MKITDRRVLITGAGSGIGRQLAVRFAAAGGSVAVVGRRPDTLEETARLVTQAGGTAHVVPADLAERGGVADVVTRAVDALGGLEIVVNNAGNVSAGPLEDLSFADIQAMIDVDLVAPILVAQAALPALRRESEGLILGVSSGLALVGLPFYAVYAAVKAGLARFDEALRRELLDSGIRVATVYPGATATPMMDTNRAGDDLGFGRRAGDDVVDEIIAGIEADAIEINTALPERRGMQDLNRTDPGAVDDALRPRLEVMRATLSGHRAM